MIHSFVYSQMSLLVVLMYPSKQSLATMIIWDLLMLNWQYNEVDNRWNFPGHYYRMRFVSNDEHHQELGQSLVTCIWFLDTNRFEDPQLAWLRRTLNTESQDCTWRLVLGHHPLFSGGEYHKSSRVLHLRSKIFPLLKEGNVDVYLSGHEHESQLLIDTDTRRNDLYKPSFIISGLTAYRQ